MGETCLQGFLAFRILRCTNCMVFFFFVFFFKRHCIGQCISTDGKLCIENKAIVSGKNEQIVSGKHCQWETDSLKLDIFANNQKHPMRKYSSLIFFTTDGNISRKCFLIEMFAKIHKIYFFTIIFCFNYSSLQR